MVIFTNKSEKHQQCGWWPEDIFLNILVTMTEIGMFWNWERSHWQWRVMLIREVGEANDKVEKKTLMLHIKCIFFDKEFCLIQQKLQTETVLFQIFACKTTLNTAFLSCNINKWWITWGLIRALYLSKLTYIYQHISTNTYTEKLSTNQNLVENMLTEWNANNLTQDVFKTGNILC